jgi:hypothetical protein
VAGFGGESEGEAAGAAEDGAFCDEGFGVVLEGIELDAEHLHGCTAGYATGKAGQGSGVMLRIDSDQGLVSWPGSGFAEFR